MPKGITMDIKRKLTRKQLPITQFDKQTLINAPESNVVIWENIEPKGNLWGESLISPTGIDYAFHIYPNASGHVLKFCSTNDDSVFSEGALGTFDTLLDAKLYASAIVYGNC